MRFQNGQWLQKEGVKYFSGKHIWETKIEKSVVAGEEIEELVFLTPSTRINHNGDTLGGVVLEIRVSIPAEEVIRLRAIHYRGEINHGPNFELKLNNRKNIDYDETEAEFSVSSGNLTFKINKNDASISFCRDGEILATSKGDDLAYVKTDWQGDYYNDHKPGTNFFRSQFGIDIDETFYGFGEKFTPFVKNGQTVEIWNEDGGTSTDQSYKSIPFYLSSKGYGLLVNNSDKVEFEIATENVSKIALSVPGEELDYFFFNGPDLKDIVKRYTDMTGKPALPPQWSFGLWLSTSFTTKYDEETVMHFIDGMIEREIPLSVFHFDTSWMKEFHWTSFVWDKNKFPEPEKMIKKIHDKNIKTCVWINPYVGQASEIFDEGVKNGYFLKRENGDVWQWDMWQPGMAIVDFTNPEAVEWYKSGLRKLLDMGIDSFKTDFGERIPTDVVYHNGANPKKMHNYYTYLFNKTVFELLEEVKGKNEAVLFARSATVGGQQFPVHWGGDCWSNYPSMAESLRGGLSLTASGFGFWSHDIGGFEDKSTADVYKRWAAFGLLSTHSRLHGSTSYRVPWNYDDEAVDVVRYFTKLKMKLMPYIYSQAVKTHNTGVPMTRAMIFDYLDDKNVRYLDKQYLFGDSIIVAPVFNEEGISSVYLPAGKWTHFITGEELDIEDGKWINTKEDYFSLPIWVKENSIIPIRKTENDEVNKDFTSEFADDLAFELFNINTNQKVEVYDNNELLSVLNLELSEDGTEAKVSFEGKAAPVYIKDKIYNENAEEKEFTIKL